MKSLFKKDFVSLTESQSTKERFWKEREDNGLGEHLKDLTEQFDQKIREEKRRLEEELALLIALLIEKSNRTRTIFGDQLETNIQKSGEDSIKEEGTVLGEEDIDPIVFKI